MSRALLITNPAAARTQQRAVEAVMRVMRGAGWNAEATTGADAGPPMLLCEPIAK